jgi:23S rRNA pseudouridine2605 synthase
VRLAKFLARAGIASRRRAEVIISQGRVKINGITANLPQMEVEEMAAVTVDGKLINRFENKYYILLNKPPGYISTVYDTHNRPTVTSLISDIKARLYPVGRLDADTRGVLLLTNDGELAYRLTHPRYQIEKVYHAWVSGLPDEHILEQMETGLIIDGEKTAPASVRIIKKAPDHSRTLLEITLVEGRKRQVKKMCSAVGCPVKNLCRVSFAGLSAHNLPEGSYRQLQKQEIKALYSLVKL